LLCSRSVVLRGGPELWLCQSVLCCSVVLLGPELLGPELCGCSKLRLHQQLRLRMLLPPPLLRFVRTV
jgi:hypothetical protein